MIHFALMWVHPWSRATRFWASPLESPDQIQVVSRRWSECSIKTKQGNSSQVSYQHHQFAY